MEDGDTVVHCQPRIFAEVLDLVDEFPGLALQHQIRGQRGLEHGELAGLPFRRVPLCLVHPGHDLVTREDDLLAVKRDAETAVPLQRAQDGGGIEGPHGAGHVLNTRTQARPQQIEADLDLKRHVAAGIVHEPDRLDIQLVGQLRQQLLVVAQRAVPGHQQDGRQRLADLDPGVAPGRPAKGDEGPHPFHQRIQILVYQGPIRGGNITQMHALRRIRLHRPHQVLIDPFGEEWDKRREHKRQGTQGMIQGVVGGALVVIILALPKPPPAAAHVPVGEVVHKRFHRPAGACGIVLVQVLLHCGGQPVRTGEQPSIQCPEPGPGVHQ